MKKILHITLIAAIAIGLFFLIEAIRKPKIDYAEYFCGYDDRISFIVEGYQAHWDRFSPEDLDLSYIYRYESPYGGFVKYDINGDGTEELLLGDQFETGDYEIYDIFTFNRKNGNIIHLFCGGERDRCTLNGSGVIIETGSSSAEDSFTQCYVLKNLKLKKLRKDEPVTPGLLALDFDKFINYAKPEEEHLCGGYTQQHELSDEDLILFHKVMGGASFTPLSVATQVVAGLNYKFRCRYDDGTESSPGHCIVTIYQPLQGEPAISAIQDENSGPEMRVIVDDNGNVGRYIDEDKTSYHGEIQDEYRIEKSKAHTEVVRAGEGQGILTLKMPGEQPAVSLPDTNANIVGTLIHEEGYVPETYRCLGYIRGWFLVDVGGKPGFIQESLASWDAISSF